MKVRTNLSLSEVNHRWLKERAGTTGEMSEYLDAMVQRERTMRPLLERIEAVVNQLLALQHEANQGSGAPPTLHVNPATGAIDFETEDVPPIAIPRLVVVVRDCPHCGNRVCLVHERTDQ